jgi:outer membrane lipoprotein-sorting protein
MKKIIIPLLLAFIFTTPSYSQTADEILAKYFETIGQEKLLETKTFTTKGKIIQGQFEIPFTSSHKRPMKFRSDASFQGMEIASAFDGEKGWSINPFAGGTDPVPMTADQVDKMKIQADYDGIYYNYEEKGYNVEFTGTEDVDDIETYVIKLTRPTGDVITSYIDSENYVILKTVSKIKVQGVDTEAETIFSNYKYIDGILNPFAIETKVNGNTVLQMVFEEFTYNVDVPDSLFEMPEVTTPADSLSEIQDVTTPVDSTDSE